MEGNRYIFLLAATCNYMQTGSGEMAGFVAPKLTPKFLVKLVKILHANYIQVTLGLQILPFFIMLVHVYFNVAVQQDREQVPAE